VHMNLPVDPNLAQASLGSKKDNEHNIKNVYELVKIASDEGFEVEFSAEGYSSLGDTIDYVTNIFRAAVADGVKVINCPD
ncbi:2-isopropylmalate synthase, partial [Francisella tularensis subsp. holarctica]|nr:2-isopropylmalate synthase [Francisella tularensis subsp. holarctica]